MEEYTNYLIHHGVKGQRWGVRRYQNPDGSLTEQGKNKLNKYKKKQYSNLQKREERFNKKYEKAKIKGKLNNQYRKVSYDLQKVRFNVERSALKHMTLDDVSKERKAMGKRIVKSVVITAGSAALAGATGMVGLAIPGIVSIPLPNRARINNRVERELDKRGLG